MSASPRKLHSESVPQSSSEESHVRHLQPAPSSTGVGCVTRDSFAVATESHRNPNAALIEANALKLGQKLGLLTPQNRRKFEAFNTIVAYTYPTATVERGVTCAQWCNWLFLFDDMHDEDLERCRDVSRVSKSMDKYLRLLREGGSAEGATPFEMLTIDAHDRFLAFGGRLWLERIVASATDYLKLGMLRAVENWATLRMPNLEGYLVQREYDSGVHTAIDLIEIANDIYLPSEIRDSGPMRRARSACARTVAYFNDIVSYPKEVLINRNPNNLIHVLVSEREMSLCDAVSFARDLVNDCTRDLVAAEEELRDVAGAHRKEVEIYLHGMRVWQRGNIDWSLDGERYASRWSPLDELVRPDSIR